MTNYFRTYGDLKDQVKKYGDFKCTLATRVHGFENLMKQSDFDCTIDAVLLVAFGAAYFGLWIEDALKKFRSNKFFSDSLGINLLPSNDNVNYFFTCVSKQCDLNPSELQHILMDVVGGSQIHASETLIDYEFLDKNGYLVIPDVLDENFCDELNILTRHLAGYERNVLGRGYVYGSGKMQRVYSLISKDPVYQEILGNPIVECVMRHMFYRETFHDKYYLTSFHANLLEPDSENQIWHVDANVPEPLPSWIIRSNSNYITQDYTKDNGATEIIPGSHLWCKKPNHQEAEEGVLGAELAYIEAPKGSLAFWHGHLWHRSGRNSSSQTRVALLGAYAASHMREVSMEENPYLNLDLNQIQSLTEKTKSIIGWNHGSKNYY